MNIYCLIGRHGPFSFNYYSYELNEKKNKPKEYFETCEKVCDNCKYVIEEAHLNVRNKKDQSRQMVLGHGS